MVRGTSALGGCRQRRPEPRPARGHVSCRPARAISQGRSNDGEHADQARVACYRAGEEARGDERRGSPRGGRRHRQRRNRHPEELARRLPWRSRLRFNHVTGTRRSRPREPCGASASGPARFVSLARGPTFQRRRAPLASRPCRRCGIDVSTWVGECPARGFRQSIWSRALKSLFIFVTMIFVLVSAIRDLYLWSHSRSVDEFGVPNLTKVATD